VRALIVTSMYPSPERPAHGGFVRDQVEALREIAEAEIEVFAFAPGDASRYVRAAADLRSRHGRERFDIVHSHFGLTAWPAFAAHGKARAVTLHGTDLEHPRSRKITLAALPFQDLVATVSGALARRVPAWAPRGMTAVLPCGVNVDRFKAIPREQARAELGLDPDGPYLLFPADPGRPEKCHDRALEVAGDVRLLVLNGVDPEQVPLWVNAANAVLVPSERESFGLAVLEALACDVPVLATPVGIAPTALAGVAGALCAPFDAVRWREAVSSHLAAEDPRIQGRARAEEFSAERMAARVMAAWKALM
jgi:teichuronic acid biosynthesis glycosyltransferase TuaC